MRISKTPKITYRQFRCTRKVNATFLRGVFRGSANKPQLNTEFIRYPNDLALIVTGHDEVRHVFEAAHTAYGFEFFSNQQPFELARVLREIEHHSTRGNQSYKATYIGKGHYVSISIDRLRHDRNDFLISIASPFDDGGIEATGKRVMATVKTQLRYDHQAGLALIKTYVKPDDPYAETRPPNHVPLINALSGLGKVWTNEHLNVGGEVGIFYANTRQEALPTRTMQGKDFTLTLRVDENPKRSATGEYLLDWEKKLDHACPVQWCFLPGKFVIISIIPHEPRSDEVADQEQINGYLTAFLQSLKD